MKGGSLNCKDEQRRVLVRHQGANGLDYLEVSEDQLSLTVYFLGKAPLGLTEANLQLRGGRRIRDIRIVGFELCQQRDPELDDCLVIELNKFGDYSTYTLCLVDLDEQGRPTDAPYPGLDPRYTCLEFSFKVNCPSDLDCKQEPVCPAPEYEQPEINYLAKDYASFRQLMLDRLALTMPEWQERHVPDSGIALVEVLAYVGDHLSYYQDAVGTEAYLQTAQQRISVRRHARLVDYRLHEGCNARAWLHIAADQNIALELAETYFITDHPDLPRDQRVLTNADLVDLKGSSYVVFEPLYSAQGEKIVLREAHNSIRLYTWGDAECCLAQGATEATLADGEPPVVAAGEAGSRNARPEPAGSATPSPSTPDDAVEPRHQLHLQPGDFLLVEELRDPKTGNPADANPAHRHVVRLTRVERGIDPLNQQPVLEIGWAEEDALPFPLCVSAVASDCSSLDPVSVARGNLVLVDHGRRVSDESLGEVPAGRTETDCEDPCSPSETKVVPGAYNPELAGAPLTFSEPLPAAAATILLRQDPRKALPAVGLTGAHGNQVRPWLPRSDLLDSGPHDAHFAVEIDDERRAHLRFGDGELGRRPEVGTAFSATYRRGNGPAGNVGAEAIVHVVQRRSSLDGVQLSPRNPLPAVGGTAPELTADARLFAPEAYRRTLRRAITPDDYAAIVMREFPDRVQRAAASLRWTGSWYEVLVAIDPYAVVCETDLASLLEEIRGCLFNYRRIGHDVQIARARAVPLDIALLVCAEPDYLRGHVKAALLELFSNRSLPAGGRGFFHPDNLSFGEGVYLSQLVAKAQAVEGVERVTVTRLQRLYEGDNGELDAGVLRLGPLEIARLDNDRSFPENGKMAFDMRGGR